MKNFDENIISPKTTFCVDIREGYVDRKYQILGKISDLC